MRSDLLSSLRVGTVSVFDAIRRLDEASDRDSNGRKLDGVVYTPVDVAKSMVRLLRISVGDTVLEPSCGRGTFLFAVIEVLVEEQGWSWEAAARWAETHLFAQDIDSIAVQDVLDLWTAYFAHRGLTSSLAHQVRAQDGLSEGWSERTFSVIVGNPPYVRFQNLEAGVRERLQAAYLSCAKGNVDLYYAFMEQAHRQAQRWCLIVPNSWLTNASARALRHLLRPTVDAVIDFETRLVFAPVRAYVCIVVCRNDASLQDPIRYRHNLVEEGGAWHEADRQGQRCQDRRWDLRAGDRAPHEGSTLGDHALIHGGIATLADAMYALPTEGRVETVAADPVGSHAAIPWGERGWVGQDPLREHAPMRVPLDLAPRVVKMTKTRSRAEMLAQTARMLCPYDADWRVWTEDRLRQAAPDVMAWFEARAERLRARDKGAIDAYDAWYAYGRRQGFLTLPADERLLLIPIMAHGPLNPIEITAGELGGRFLVQSGYVVRAKIPEAFDRIKAMLASDATWQVLKREGKAWAGGKDYRTFGARLLRALPWTNDDDAFKPESAPEAASQPR